MSQENQNTQPSSNSINQQSSTQTHSPFWKASLIKALRGTIGILENTAQKLETETETETGTKPQSDRKKKSGFLQKLQQLWSQILGKIRLILPAQSSAKLTDTALTGIIMGIAIAILLIATNIFSNEPPQVATVSPDTESTPIVDTPIETPKSEEPTVSEQPVANKTPKQEEIVSLPSDSETNTNQEEIVSLPPEETSTKPELETPLVTEPEEISPPQEEPTSLPPDSVTIIGPELEAPTIIEPETIPSPQVEETIVNSEIDSPEETLLSEEIETTPELPTLTPEETLIAAIQNQVTEISDRIFSGIIESIQANFLDSNLTIKISNDWYQLEKSQQDEFAAEILQCSEELDFTHLEITDTQGKLLARNPVVGTEMIILKRRSGEW